MAFIQCDMKSEVLGLSCSLHVILNQKSLENYKPGQKSPVLYLLHGLSNDHTTWTRRTSIERYAEKYDVTVVMPSVGRSFYANMFSGYRYMDFLSDELPNIVRKFFPVSEDPAQTFLAGNSMGGYGAFKLALTYPDRYAAAASLSGPLDLWLLNEKRDEFLPEWKSIFGDDQRFIEGPNDLVSLAQKASQRTNLPKLFHCCGKDDYLLGPNQSYQAKLRAFGIDAEYLENEGDHEWSYWDRSIQDVLAWLPLSLLPED